LDFDDALSLSTEGENFVVGIHIADVGHYITKEDPIDQEAFSRASSIYTPDRKISMLPAELALDLCSLKADHDRPAISTLITLSPKGKIIHSEIMPSIIRVKEQLTYQDVDEIVDTDETIASMYAIAQKYRNERLDNGALLIELPEIYIGLNPSGPPQVTRVERDSAAHLIVAEMMILANDIAARFLSRHNLPAIFRGQAKPRERLFDRDTGSLFQNWMQRKQISRFTLSTTAAPHSGLGLDGYVTCTSPIRKYTDMITQRQLRAAFGMETAYTAEQMEFIIAALAESIAVVGRIQTRRNRYWLFKHLETKIGQKAEAIVLYKRRDSYFILIPDYLIECNLSGADHVTLKSEDLVQVTFQHVSARNDILHVYLG
jgi:exoribonuclease-2